MAYDAIVFKSIDWKMAALSSGGKLSSVHCAFGAALGIVKTLGFVELSAIAIASTELQLARWSNWNFFKPKQEPSLQPSFTTTVITALNEMAFQSWSCFGLLI